MGDIGQHYNACRNTFDAVEAELNSTLKKALQAVAKRPADDYCSFPEAARRLGIYNINRRIKTARRLEQKVTAMTGEGGGVSSEDYYSRIPDIVGNRIVCLHPDDIYQVSEVVKGCCDGKLLEPAPPHSGLNSFRVRRGVFSLLDIRSFRDAGFVIDEPHEAGYTSIHFIFRLGPEFVNTVLNGLRDRRLDVPEGLQLRNCLVEVQVRTILEEAWGEVDHWIRYEDEGLASDLELREHVKSMAAYIQAGNHHISIIRGLALRKLRDRSPSEPSDPGA